MSRKVIFCEGKVSDLEETKKCTGLESADGIRPMDQGICCEDVDLSILVLGRRRVADQVKEGEEDPNSMRILTIRL